MAQVILENGTYTSLPINKQNPSSGGGSSSGGGGDFSLGDSLEKGLAMIKEAERAALALAEANMNANVTKKGAENAEGIVR